MKAQFLRLFQYNQWANNLFCESIVKANYQNKKIEALLSHILAAELIWLSRIDKVTERIPGVSEVLPLEETILGLKRADDHWLKFLVSVSEFDTIVNYTNTLGEQFQNILADIVTHVANHGTHHRGQIATLLREEGIAPPASDFIFFARN